MADSTLDKLVALELAGNDFGFYWPKVDYIFDQIANESKEVQDAIADRESPIRIQEEIGDLLHAVISVCIFYGYNPLEILTNATSKYDKRLSCLKEVTYKNGLSNLHNESLETKLAFWKEAKSMTDEAA